MFEIFLLFIIIIIIHIFLNINKNNIIYVKSTNGIYTILKDNNQEKKLNNAFLSNFKRQISNHCIAIIMILKPKCNKYN